MLKENLITAPYVFSAQHENHCYYYRLDLSKKQRNYIMATPLIEWLLSFFMRVKSLNEALMNQNNFSVVEIKEAVLKLRSINFLLSSDDLVIHVPTLELEITNACNAKCLMCPRDKIGSIGIMKEDIFSRVEILLKEAKLPGVILQGIGEPSLHRSLISWVKRMRVALPDGAPIVMVTNGFNLNSMYLAQLREAGISLIQWSLHSAEKNTYNKIMGIDKFDQVNRNLQSCIREHGDIISINFVVMQNNFHEIDDFKIWIKNLGLPENRLGLIEVQSRGGSLNINDLIINKKEIFRQGRCLFIKKSLFISWNGDILPCSNDISGNHVQGNIKNINSNGLIKLWRDHLLSQSPKFKICESCDHYARNTLETEWFKLIRKKPVISGKQRIM